MNDLIMGKDRQQTGAADRKNKYRLICADIDGTLLDDNKKLLPQVKQSLRNAAKKGIQIALASGRMPAGVELVEKELEISCIKICNAGTYILLGNRCIHMETLLPSTMKNIYFHMAKKNNLPLWIFQEREWYVTDIDRYIEQEIEIIRYHPEVVSVNELADQWNRKKTGPNKLLIAAEPEIIQNIQQDMAAWNLPDVGIACSADTFLEIFPKGVTKGTALSTICDTLDIPLKDTIAFGDHELDIPLIETAGVGVAMGNAISPLKEKADFVTRSNNEAGIAYALQYFLAE